MNATFLNVAALGLGLLAWLLPVLSLLLTVLRPAAAPVRTLALSTLSFAAASAALVCSIHYDAYLAQINDVSAWLDTAQPLAFVSAVLLVVAVGLNAAAVITAFCRKGART